LCLLRVSSAPLLPYSTLFRSDESASCDLEFAHELEVSAFGDVEHLTRAHQPPHGNGAVVLDDRLDVLDRPHVHFVTSAPAIGKTDRKSTRLNSSHEWIYFAVY